MANLHPSQNHHQRRSQTLALPSRKILQQRYHLLHLAKTRTGETVDLQKEATRRNAKSPPPYFLVAFLHERVEHRPTHATTRRATPQDFGVSYPMKQPAAIFLVKPTNQTSLASLVVPVLPAAGTDKLTVYAPCRANNTSHHRCQLIGSDRIHDPLTVRDNPRENPGSRLATWHSSQARSSWR